MPIPPEEEEIFRQKLQEELNKEHDFRRERAQQRLGKIKRTTLSEEFQKEKEMDQIRNEVRREFYESNGYILVEDEFGVSTWLTPEEVKINKYKKRNPQSNLVQRKNRKKYSKQKLWENFLAMLPIYLGSALIAAVIGILLVKAGS
jgi:hypothetical protein